MFAHQSSLKAKFLKENQTFPQSVCYIPTGKLDQNSTIVTSELLQ